MSNLNIKTLHPKDGDIIVITHDDPDAIWNAVESFRLSILDMGVSCTIVVVKPGFDVSLMSDEDKEMLREMLYQQV